MCSVETAETNSESTCFPIWFDRYIAHLGILPSVVGLRRLKCTRLATRVKCETFIIIICNFLSDLCGTEWRANWISFFSFKFSHMNACVNHVRPYVRIEKQRKRQWSCSCLCVCVATTRAPSISFVKFLLFHCGIVYPVISIDKIPKVRIELQILNTYINWHHKANTQKYRHVCCGLLLYYSVKIWDQCHRCWYSRAFSSSQKLSIFVASSRSHCYFAEFFFHYYFFFLFFFRSYVNAQQTIQKLFNENRLKFPWKNDELAHTT